MKLQTFLLLFPVLATIVSVVPAVGFKLESIEDNWSDEDEKEDNKAGGKVTKEAEATPAPIMSVPPVPPILPKAEIDEDDDDSSEESTVLPVSKSTVKPGTESNVENQRVTPLKIPFIPVSSVRHHLGTILKPIGFNGMKPVKMPKQVQSLPYESWNESPLSMAPGKQNRGRIV